jgi:hypothetical protein
VNGSNTIKAKAAGYLTAGIAPPVGSNISTRFDCNGNATIAIGGTFICSSPIADTTNKRAQLHGYLPDSTNTYFVRIVDGYLIK